MNKVLKITVREILTLLLALLMVMAAGLVIDNNPDPQFRNVKKFEIKLSE